MNNWCLCWRTVLQETGKNTSLLKGFRHPSNWSTAINCGLWLQLWSLHEIYSPWICPCCVPSLTKAICCLLSMPLQKVLHNPISSCSLLIAWPLVGKFFVVSSPFLLLYWVLSRCSATAVTSSLDIKEKAKKMPDVAEIKGKIPFKKVYKGICYNWSYLGITLFFYYWCLCTEANCTHTCRTLAVKQLYSERAALNSRKAARWKGKICDPVNPFAFSVPSSRGFSIKRSFVKEPSCCICCAPPWHFLSLPHCKAISEHKTHAR